MTASVPASALIPPRAVSAVGALTDAAATRRPYLILIRGAPIWDPDSQIRLHATALSEHFDGEIWFGTGEPYEKSIGKFRVVGVAMQEFRAIAQFRHFFPEILRDIARRRAELNQRNVIVISYDPLLQGIFGAYLSWKLNARFITEFSGSYSELPNYERKSFLAAATRREIFRLIAQCVVLQAHGVRQLYPGQAARFVHLRRRTKQMVYFNAVNSDRFEAPLTSKSQRVLFVGTPFWRKGVDVLINAWTQVSDDYPGWTLSLIGADLTRHIDVDAATRLRVDLPGPMPHDQLATHVRNAAILVLPSRSEAMGRILLEAATARCARIGTRVGGIPQVIEHEIDGLLVDGENVDHLSMALRRLMSDASLRERLGEAAHQRMQTTFSGAAYARSMKQFIDAMIAETATKQSDTVTPCTQQ